MKVPSSLLMLAAGVLLCSSLCPTASASCSVPVNQIEAENCLPGTASSVWDIDGSGDPTIQGFATDISVNAGQTITFKIKTDAPSYAVNIYRVGYYGGKGARLVASVQPSASLPQVQPSCFSDSATGLVDCGNWAVSASWSVPSSAVSGVYFAHLIRSDTGGDSHIIFIVRNDTSHSAVLFQTSDETWQAYNGYGGTSLYGPDGEFDLAFRGYKVSYNRPFDTRSFSAEAATWFFGAEYPMVRWLESNAYDVTYFTGVDAARTGALIANHKLYLSVGHDEYWSSEHRASVEAARDAGVNLAFFSGNEVFWKTRWENSYDGTATPYRTLVCYKETLAGQPIDPLDPFTWTGTWRDARFSPPADGGRPENALTGTLFTVNGTGPDNDGTQSIKVPAADGQMRFWRNTTIASLTPGTTATLPKGTLGYEWDEDIDNGFRPGGNIELSTSSYKLTVNRLLDAGATYGAGTAVHHLTLHRASSGALVFGAGTVQWSWGLDSVHDNPFFSPNTAADPRMQQATVNLFADMGVQPGNLRSTLQPATASADSVPPVSSITWPTDGALLPAGSAVTITGTAADSGGGVVGGVEISVDGGNSWHAAVGRENWTYTWTPGALGSFTLQSRATDDSANTESSASTASVVTVNPPDCPCTEWSSSQTPATVDSGDPSSGEFGVRFRADFDGYVRGIRFYKASTNTGTHIGSLWSNSGQLLARATFTSETASGWQQVSFSTPVPITANTTYVASYFAPSGHYSATSQYFASKGVDSPPLHLLANGMNGANGIYTYSAAPSFPVASFNAANYWVDVVYVPASAMPGAPPALLVNPASLNFAGFTGQPGPLSQTVSLYNQGSGTLDYSAVSDSAWLTVSLSSGVAPSSLTVSANTSGLPTGVYSGKITVSSSGATNAPQVITVVLKITNLLLSSDFSDGTMAGWAFSPLGFAANWTVANDSLFYNGGGHTQVYSGSSAWTDYTFTASFKLSTSSDYPGGIRGRVDPLTGGGYAVWLYPQEGLIKLFRNTAWNIDTGLVLLGQAPAAFDTASAHGLQLSFQGSKIQVLYDGNAVITVSDATYTSGVVALDVSNQPIAFGNILVTSDIANSSSLTTASALNFASTYQANPAAQALQLTSSPGLLVWTAGTDASWLKVTPGYGVTPIGAQVSVQSASLAPGSYSGSVTVVSLGSTTTTRTVPVSLTVVMPPPVLVVNPQSLDFVSVAGQPLAANIVNVTNGASSGSFVWTASASVPWLGITPSSGSTPQSITVLPNTAGLANGTYTASVTVIASGIGAYTVPVTLRVLSPAMQESFSDLASGWIVSPMGLASGWSASNGVYRYSGIGLSQSCAGNSAWSDYTFDTNIQFSNLFNWPGGVRGRVNPATGAGYAVWLYPQSGQAILYRVPQWNINDPGLTQIAQAAASLDVGGPHDLKMDFRGSQISVYWDGSLLMSAVDNTYGTGYVCLDADSQPITYSNIQVAAVQNQLTVDPITPSSLIFNAGPGVTPAPRTLAINAGSSSTTWNATSNATWLTVTTSGPLTPGSMTVSVNSAGLVQGSYSGSILVSVPGATNSPIVVPVTLVVGAAALSVSPSSLTFFGAVGLNPTPQTINIANGGTGTLSWTAGAGSTWLGLGTTAGTTPSSVTVTPNAGATGAGTFSDVVTFTSPGAANSPVALAVSMQVGLLLFSDDFSSGSAANWTNSPLGLGAGWSVSNGTYKYDGSGHTQSFAGSTAWTDYTVAADFQLASGSNYPGGIRGRVNTTTGASYGVWIYPEQQMLRLFRIGSWNIDTDLTLLGQSGPVNIDTQWHNLRLVFKGPAIQVYYDGALVVSQTDTSYAQGAVALDVSNQPIAFDNITVIAAP